MTAEDTLLMPNTSAATVQSILRRTSAEGEALGFVATPPGDCTGNQKNITMIAFNNMRPVQY